MESLKKEENVHIWSLCGYELKNKENYLLETKYLDQGELKRADEFYFQQDKITFSYRRYWLKRLLSEYLGIETSKVNIRLSNHKKPILEKKRQTLQFNISHSNDFVLYAFSRNQSIGVDVEYYRNKINFMGVASRFFTEDEYMILKEAKNENRLSLFYNIWTCKEAYLKYCGTGLYREPSTFSLFSLKEKLASFKLTAAKNKTFLAALCTSLENPKIEFFSIEDRFDA